MEESNPEEGQGAAASTADAAKTQEGKTKESRIPRWFVTFSVVVVLLIVILLIVLFGRLSSGPGGSPEASAPAETFTFDLAAVLTPADIKVITQGSAQVDQALIVPAASYALYNPAQRRLEIGFFRTPLAREVLEQLAKAQSFSDLTQVSPDIMFLIALKKSGSACEQAEIERYQVFINRNPEGAPEYLSMEFPDASGIVTIGCRFDQPAVVYAALRQDAQQQVEQGPAVRVFWDLRISSPAVVVPVTAKVAYDSTNAAAVVALWNKMDNTIEVGYFPSTLGADDREMMRKNKSLLAVPQKKPVVTAALYLNRAATSLELNNIVRYGVVFYRNPEAALEFGGPNDKEGFYYVVSPEKTDQLFALRGFLAEGEFIQGRLRHEGTKVLDQTSTKFNWDLVFDTPLLDVFAQPEPGPADSQDTTAGAAKAGDKDKETAKEPEGPYMQASAGSTIADFATAIALYYPQQNDLAVGFYTSELSPEEKEQVRKNKVLWQYVNNKRPNLVLFFDFRFGATQLSAENLNGYTVYFTRDKIGSFFFPGSLDQISFARQTANLREGELKVLEGDLKDGGKVKLNIKGTQNARGGEKFSWNVNFSTEMKQVQ